MAAAPLETPKTSTPLAVTASANSGCLSSAITSTRPRARSEGLVMGSFSGRGVIIRLREVDESNKVVWGGQTEISVLRGKGIGYSASVGKRQGLTARTAATNVRIRAWF